MMQAGEYWSYWEDDAPRRFYVRIACVKKVGKFWHVIANSEEQELKTGNGFVEFGVGSPYYFALRPVEPHESHPILSMFVARPVIGPEEPERSTMSYVRVAICKRSDGHAITESFEGRDMAEAQEKAIAFAGNIYWAWMDPKIEIEVRDERRHWPRETNEGAIYNFEFRREYQLRHERRD